MLKIGIYMFLILLAVGCSSQKKVVSSKKSRASKKVIPTAVEGDTMLKPSGTMRVRKTAYDEPRKIVKPIPVPSKQRLD